MKKTSLTLALLASLAGGLAFNAVAQEKKADAKPEAKAEAKAVDAKAPEAKPEAKPEGTAGNAAIVNNKPIPKKTLDEFLAALAAQGRAETPELRKQALDDLINREVFVQEAEKRGLMRNADVVKQLENVKRDLMIRALIRQQLQKSPVTEADMKAEYDKVSQGQGGQKEYKARHILVEKEDVAKGIIEQLKKGAKFEDLAKQSKDPGSGANGGDLDWNVPGTFVPEFSQAMVKLEKGKFTEIPVKSQFGYHVIRLDDTRESKPPAFEQVKQQIQQGLEQRKIQAFVQDLRAKATIK
jgi:peptidyl-prolyl cis-trans isomerase C